MMFETIERDDKAVLRPISSPFVSPAHSTRSPQLVSPIEDRRKTSRGIPGPHFQVSPPRSPELTFGGQWAKASYLLRKNPSRVTRRVFLTSLKHSPPLDLVVFMISANPDVATIPKEGPTALQVAIEHKAPLDVIRVIIDACPFALCATNPGFSIDPLEYARKCP